MFAFFAQHFTHQFFKTSGKMGRGFTKALGHGVRGTRGHAGSDEGTGACTAFWSSLDTVLSRQVDLGHLYGDNLQRQHQLRLFRDGKLKFQVPPGTTKTCLSPAIQGCLKPMSLWQLLGQSLLGASGDPSPVGDPSPAAPCGAQPGPPSVAADRRDELWGPAVLMAAGVLQLGLYEGAVSILLSTCGRLVVVPIGTQVADGQAFTRVVFSPPSFLTSLLVSPRWWMERCTPPWSLMLWFTWSTHLPSPRRSSWRWGRRCLGCCRGYACTPHSGCASTTASVTY